MLKLCGDEESVPLRALHFLVGVLQCRAMAEPESRHSTWNDYKRAVSAAGLQHVNIKATYIGNYGHCPFLAGRGAVESASALQQVSQTRLLQTMASGRRLLPPIGGA